MSEVVKVGIKESKEMLVFLFMLGKVMKEAKENDGKIDYMDAMLLMKLMPLMGPAFEGVSEIMEEIKDIDAAEADELIKYLAEETGSILEGKEDLIAKIISGLEVAKSINNFAKLF